MDHRPTACSEALIGGGVALVVNSLLFPPNPVKMVDRALLPLVEDLARALERTAAALASGEREEARRALWSARGIDERVDALEDAVEVGRETARFAPLRRPSLGRLDVYEEQVRHLDFAVRNTRVLARAVDRFVRGGGSAPEELPAAIRELAGAVRALGEDDDAGRSSAAARRLAALAARRAGAVLEPRRDLATSAIVSQIRSTAADLLRAADPGVDERQPSYETPTDELLAEPLASAATSRAKRRCNRPCASRPPDRSPLTTRSRAAPPACAQTRDRRVRRRCGRDSRHPSDGRGPIRRRSPAAPPTHVHSPPDHRARALADRGRGRVPAPTRWGPP